MKKKVVPTRGRPSEPGPLATTSAALLARLIEPSTWAGLLTIGSVFATGGVASWLNPTTLPSLLAGLGLIVVREPKSPTPGSQRDVPSTND